MANRDPDTTSTNKTLVSTHSFFLPHVSAAENQSQLVFPITLPYFHSFEFDVPQKQRAVAVVVEPRMATAAPALLVQDQLQSSTVQAQELKLQSKQCAQGLLVLTFGALTARKTKQADQNTANLKNNPPSLKEFGLSPFYQKTLAKL